MSGQGWDRQINGDGGTLADAARADLEAIDFRLIRVLDYLDLIAECLTVIAWQASPDAGRREADLTKLRRE